VTVEGEQRPPLARWWVTYVLVGAGAVVAVLLALRLLAEVVAPLSHVIFVVLFGVIVASVLAPIVDALQPYVRRRPIAVALAAVLALAVLAIAVALLAVPLIRETQELADDVPRYIATLSSDDPVVVLGFEISGELRQRFGQEIGARAAELSTGAARIALRVGGVLVDLLLVLALGIYLLATGPRARVFVLRLVPRRHRAEVENVEAEARRLFGSYVRGQLFLGLVVGTLSGVAYFLLGVPYAVFLGVLAGILELVPIAGPIVAGAVAALVALTQPLPLVLWVILAAIAIQQIENNVLVPRIAGPAVGLHPLAALIAVLVGVEVGGILGALFAVPVTGLAWSIYRARVRTQPLP
jgi:predicted PurR-regulated permease PerM